MTRQVTVSAIMAAYNTAAVIGEAIESIQGQSFTDWELIIVDDGSTDETFAVAQAYTDPRIKVHRLAANRGRPGARNEALRHATGRYIAICDSDDIQLPERFATEVTVLDAQPGIDIIGGQIRFIWAGSAPRTRVVYPLDPDVIRASFNAGKLNFSCATMMVRAEVFARFGGYDEEFLRSEDADLCFRIRNDCRFLTLPVPLMHYRHELNSIPLRKWFDTRWYQRYACYRNGITPPADGRAFRTFKEFSRSWKNRVRVYTTDTARLLYYTLRSYLPIPHPVRSPKPRPPSEAAT